MKKEVSQLKIYIVSIDPIFTYKAKELFKDEDNVYVVNDDIRKFYELHKEEIDCLVSPANAFGYMTGGYDAALSDILGWSFQANVQKYIVDNFYGEQVVGTSFIIPTNIEGVSLIHTPTMQYPSVIFDDMVIYHSMRSTLICALKNDVKCIVIPAFGAATGGVKGSIVAKRMQEAYMQIKTHQGAMFSF